MGDSNSADLVGDCSSLVIVGDSNSSDLAGNLDKSVDTAGDPNSPILDLEDDSQPFGDDSCCFAFGCDDSNCFDDSSWFAHIFISSTSSNNIVSSVSSSASPHSELPDGFLTLIGFSGRVAGLGERNAEGGVREDLRRGEGGVRGVFKRGWVPGDLR